MKFFAKCGKELQDDARFCGGCGSGGDVISANENKATFGTPPLSVDASEELFKVETGEKRGAE